MSKSSSVALRSAPVAAPTAGSPMLESSQVLKQSVGLDVSKSSVAACFAQQELGKPFRVLSNQQFSTSREGFKAFQTWVDKHKQAGKDVHFVMEATGVYYEEWAYYLHGKNYSLSVMLPSLTAAYAKSLSYKSKTDKIDAKILAQLSLERSLPNWQPFSDKMLTIKRLCRERAELVEEKTVAKNRLHAKNHAYATDKEALKRGQKMIEFLKKQIKDIEKAIQQTVNQDPDIAQRVKNLMSIPGIGLVTAATVLSEANGFTLFKNKAQLVSYAGYDVREFSSGESVEKKKHISKKGNTRIRKALYFAALAAVKKQGQFKALYERVCDTTKIKMKAYVAVQRKLLVLMYAIYKNNKAFDSNYTVKTPQQNLNLNTKI